MASSVKAWSGRFGPPKGTVLAAGRLLGLPKLALQSTSTKNKIWIAQWMGLNWFFVLLVSTRKRRRQSKSSAGRRHYVPWMHMFKTYTKWMNFLHWFCRFLQPPQYHQDNKNICSGQSINISFVSTPIRSIEIKCWIKAFIHFFQRSTVPEKLAEHASTVFRYHRFFVI